MVNFDPQRFLAIICSSYGKRLLEKPYDRLAESELFQKLKEQPKIMKHVIELASYLATALMEQNADESTPLKRALNEILMDVGPELSKRMLNGESISPDTIEVKASKYTDLVTKPEHKLFIQTLLEKLDISSVVKIAAWMNASTPEEKGNILKYIKNLDAKKVEELSQLTSAEASQLFTAFEKPPSPILPLTRKVLEDRLDSFIDRRKKKGGGNGQPA